MTPAFAERIGLDMVEIMPRDGKTARQIAMEIRELQDEQNRRTSAESRRKATEEALMRAHAQAEANPQADAQPELRPVPPAAVPENPQTPEEALRAVESDVGPEVPVASGERADPLAALTRNELFGVIEKRQLKVKKVGTKADLVKRIRAAIADLA
jgi:hypothetical protein